MRARLITLLLRLFATLSLHWNHRLGGLLGWLLAHTPNPLRTYSERNLALCLPELSTTARQQLLRDSLIETGKTAFEAGPLWNWPAAKLRSLVCGAENAEAIDAAILTGKGVIVATPHLGSWEMGGHFCAMRWGITTLYRPPRIAALDAVIRQGRERCGSHMVPTDASGVRQLYETLSKGGVIAMLPDQDPGDSGGVFAPFFGIPANSMRLLGRLARKTGAAVFFGFCERLPAAQGYQLHFIPAPEGIADTDPVIAAAAMNRGVETFVRAYPAQYQWSYRRFRTRPPGSAKLY